MKRLFAILVLFAVPVSAATISGTVTQAGGGPLSSMTVQAWDEAGSLKATATTDALGRYSLTVTAGAYHVLAYDPAGVHATSFYPDADSFETSALVTTDATNINFALVRAGLVSGTVRDGNDGAPLANMTVAAYNPTGTRRGFTKSDAAGRYQLALPPGTYTLAAYDETLNYLTVVAPAPVTVTAATTVTLDFRLDRGTTLTGTVTPGAVVSLYRDDLLYATAASDSAGKYRTVLPPGTYKVVIFDPSGTYATLFYPGADSFETAPPILLAAGETRTIDATLVRAGTFAGSVTNSSGATLAGITVAAYNPSGTRRAFTKTGADGRYSLAVPPGNYAVAAFDPALIYLTRFYPNQLSFATALQWSAFAGQTTTLDFVLPRGAVVTGHVQNSTEAALPSMTVGAYDARGLLATATTDAAGSYRLLLEPGTYSIAAFDPAFHFATSTANVSLVTAQTLVLDFVLVAGARVSGVVMTAADVRVGGLTAAAYDSAGVQVTSVAARQDGSFDLVVPPGTYRFAAYDPLGHFDSLSPTTPYTLTAGGSAAGVVLRVAPHSIGRRRAAGH
jgi:hypothetical protein